MIMTAVETKREGSMGMRMQDLSRSGEERGVIHKPPQVAAVRTGIPQGEMPNGDPPSLVLWGDED